MLSRHVCGKTLVSDSHSGSRCSKRLMTAPTYWAFTIWQATQSKHISSYGFYNILVINWKHHVMDEKPETISVVQDRRRGFGKAQCGVGCWLPPHRAPGFSSPTAGTEPEAQGRLCHGGGSLRSSCSCGLFSYPLMQPWFGGCQLGVLQPPPMFWGFPQWHLAPEQLWVLLVRTSKVRTTVSRPWQHHPEDTCFDRRLIRLGSILGLFDTRVGNFQKPNTRVLECIKIYKSVYL